MTGKVGDRVVEHAEHVFGIDPEIDDGVEAALVDFFFLVIAVEGGVFRRGFTPDHQRHLFLQRHPHGIGEDAGVAVPAKITTPPQGLEHELADHLPVRCEVEHINAQGPEGPQVVLDQGRTHEAVIESDDQRFESEFAHQIPEGVGRILAARERHDAVIVILPARALDDVVELDAF